MAFEDALGGSPPDPNDVLDSLIRQNDSTIPADSPVDPAAVVGRLSRKLLNDAAARRQRQQAGPQKLKAEDYGNEIDPSAKLNPEDYGTEVPQAAPAAPAPPAHSILDWMQPRSPEELASVEPPPVDVAGNPLPRAQPQQPPSSSVAVTPPPPPSPPAAPQAQPPVAPYAPSIAGAPVPPAPAAPPPTLPPQSESPGFLATAGGALYKGGVEGLQESAGAFQAWQEKKSEDDPSYLGKLLQVPIGQGWKSADWWGAQLGYVFAKGSPSLALGLGGAAGGSMAAGPVGGVAGGAIGFGLGGAMQEIAPAYQRARAEGLSHEAAVDRAWTQTGIAGGFSALMGMVGGGAAASTAKAALGKALKEIFVEMPALMVGEAATQKEAEGKHLTPEEALQTAAVGGITGAAMVGGHAAIRAARGQPALHTEPPQPPPSDGWTPGYRSDPGSPPPSGGGAAEDVSAAEFHRRAGTDQNAGTERADATSMQDQFREYLRTEKGLTDDQINLMMKGMSPEDFQRAYEETVYASAKRKEEERRAGQQQEQEAPKQSEQPKRPGVEPEPGDEDNDAYYQDHAQPKQPEEPQGTGTREDPIDLKTAADVERATQVVNEDHTHAQGEANNIQRGHAEWHGMPITLETGSDLTRKGVNKDTGEEWTAKMGSAYGYWKNTVGADGQHVDVHVGPHLEGNDHAYVLDELDGETGKFRQNKTFVGFDTPQQALQAYFNSSGKHPRMAGGMRALSSDELKAWLPDHAETKKPISDAVREGGGDAVSGGQQEAATGAPTTFKTAKGSVYQVHEDGTTTRNKAARDEPGHEGDSGPKERSHRTFYLTPENANRLAPPKGKSVIVDHGNGTASTITPTRGGGVGRAPTQADVPYLDTPAKGLVPLELWGKRKVLGHDGYNKTHFGNEITEVGAPAGDSDEAFNDLHTLFGGQEAGQKTGAEAESGNENKGEDGQKTGQKQASEEDIAAALDDELGLGKKPEAEFNHAEAHKAVETAITAAGQDPAGVRQADIHRAVEIMRDEGLSAEEAFPLAVTRALVEDGHLTAQQVKEDTDADTSQAILSPAEGAGNVVPAETAGTAASGTAATPAAELPQGGAENVGEGGQAGQVSKTAEGGQAGIAGAGATTSGPRASGGQPAAGSAEEQAVEPAEREPGTGGKAANTDENGTARPAKNPVTEKPLSVLQYLVLDRKKGGLKPTPDLRALELPRSVLIPGVGWRSVFRANGRTMDQVIEVLREGGYLPQSDPNQPEPSDLHRAIIEMLDEENRGRKSFPIGEEATAAEAEGGRAIEEENAARSDELEDAKTTLIAAMKDAGMSVSGSVPEDLAKAAEIMADTGIAPLDALERAAILAVLTEGDVVKPQDVGYNSLEEGLNALDQQTTAGGGSEAPGRGEGHEVVAGAGERHETGGDIRGAGESAGEEQEPAATEPGADGKPQHVIPGVEPITGGERPGSEQPVKPEQLPADEGLFAQPQGDLLDNLPPNGESTEGPSAKPEPEKPEETEKPNRLVIQTGVVLRTKSGRETSPAPKIDASTDRRTHATVNRINQWLLDEARIEAKDNEHVSLLLKNLDVKNWSQADGDLVNDVLFGDAEGATEANVVKPEEKPIATAGEGTTTGPTPPKKVRKGKSGPSVIDILTGGGETEGEKPKNDIQDAGEKIGGARKDQWAREGLDEDDIKGMNEAEKAKHVTKENVFPRPDYVDLVDNGGVDKTAAALLKIIYDRISARPPEGQYSSVAPEDYIRVLGKVRELAKEAKTVEDVEAISGKLGWKEERSIRPARLRSNVLSISYDEKQKAAKMVDRENFPWTEPWMRQFFVRKNRIWGDRDKREPYQEAFNVAVSLFKDAKISLNEGGGDEWFSQFGGTDKPFPNSRSPWFSKWGTQGKELVDPASLTGDLKQTWDELNKLFSEAYGGGTQYGVYRKPGREVSQHPTEEEAIEAAKKAYEGVLSGEGEGEGGKMPTEHPHLDTVSRTGPDYRGGKDIAATDDFIKQFGYRGAEFGNWATQAERQKLLNLAWDALHDLARALNLTPEALSLNGTNAIGFGSRGRGGKNAGSAHYEADLLVTNMTKINGAGSAAHEWMHALDHYLGETHGPNPYGARTKSITGWRDRDGSYDALENRLRDLPPRLRKAAVDLIKTMETRAASPEEVKKWQKDEIERTKIGISGWQRSIDQAKAGLHIPDGKTRQRRADIARGEEAVESWRRALQYKLRRGPSTEQSNYFKNAISLGGKSGAKGYWARPNEMFARAGESYIFDKLKEAGHSSQYLVQGVEEDRFGGGFKGNPYPAGDERKAINAAFDNFFKALYSGEGKLGAQSKIKAIRADAVPERKVVTDTVEIPDVSTMEKFRQLVGEMAAMEKGDEELASGETKPASEQPTVLADHFAAHFRDGKDFPTILQARKFAKDNGFDLEAKEVEEAIEFGVVKVAREIAQTEGVVKDKFDKLVDLYGRQPTLGTRTSTSVRDQAYSTPVPLAYVSDRLARIGPETSVYEPTAGNGALLIDANPAHVRANEINDDRRSNLEAQGFDATNFDASLEAKREPVDVVIANPPFGAVLEGTESKRFSLNDLIPGYTTTNIDHAIAFRALEQMKDDGRAVLLLGGSHKMIENDPRARTLDYRGEAKRLFYKNLYARYNVADHFTVSGDLYSRQGAAWPVDVIVIEGRGKSAKALPGVEAPRVLKTWDEVGGLLNEPRLDVAGLGRPDDADAGGPLTGTAGGGNGGGQPPVGGGGNAGLAAEPGQPEGVQPGNLPVGQPGSTAVGEAGAGEGPGAGQRGKSGGPDSTPPAERQSSGVASDEEIAAALDEELGLTAKPEKTVANPLKSEDTSDGINDLLGNVAPQSSTAGPRSSEPRAGASERPAAEVGKSAIKNALDSADAAFEGLHELFGKGKTIGMGINFDPETYAKAKPMFRKAAEKFKEFWGDFTELVRRIARYMRDWLVKAKNLTEEAVNAEMAEMRDYIMQFMRDLKSGEVKLGEEEKPAAPQPKPADAATGNTEKPTEFQVPYETKSNKERGLGTLVPINMKDSIAESLDAVEAKVGDLDKFVASELGYEYSENAPAPHYIDANGDAVFPFASEQTDAIALAIYNIQKGKGFIIGDQTGIGKGRVVAAILRWAHKNGNVPIFVTEKPGLYADIYRDMRDTGLQQFLGNKEPRILMTNANENVSLDEDGTLKLKTPTGKLHDMTLRGVNADNFRDNYDFVATTYNQMQTVGKQDTARRDFLARLAPNAVFVFDESHNGGSGAANRGPLLGKDGNPLPPSRAQYIRKLVAENKGVMYSSATYAKRPDVMDLYSATDMKMAVEKIEDLAEAIARGGVPMQQVVASMLAKAGQYIRRERSFAGIDYNTPLVPVSREQYRGISQGLRGVQDFSLLMPGIREAYNDYLAETGDKLAPDPATGNAGAKSLNFTAIMHNIVNQMLLAMKAQPSVDHALAAIRANQKPVITVASTMGSFLNEYTGSMGIKEGDEFPGDFRDILQRYLKRVRTLTIKADPHSDDPPIRIYLTDDELRRFGGEHALNMFKEAEETIKGLDVSTMPVSPIDYIKQKLHEAGIKDRGQPYLTGEITGRDQTIDYSGERPLLAKRAGEDKTINGKIKMIRNFNHGGLDAMVINQSGATGISMHANKSFKDQRQRNMILAQPENNIDTHMQMLGRVNRTGQTVVPVYNQLVADIPAEKRPAANLQKKMASLNANTTASRANAVTAKDVPDFMNKYGDRVAAMLALDDRDLMQELGNPVDFTESGRPIVEGAMSAVTGRLPLLEPDRQDEIYNRLESEYKDLIEQLTAAGENALEAQTLNLKAIPRETTEVQGAKNDSGSPFAAPVTIENVSVARLGKPYTPREVMSKIGESLLQDMPPAEVKSARDLGRLLQDTENGQGAWGKQSFVESGNRQRMVKQEFDAFKKETLDDTPPEKTDRVRTALDATWARWSGLNNIMRVGRRISLNTSNGILTGIVLKIERKGEAKNPLALSTWKVDFALADANRHVALPFSRLWEKDKADQEDEMGIEVVPVDWIEHPQQTLERFEHMQSEAREDRFIATGNLLAAFDWLGRKGQIVNFTDNKGNVRQGILTARGFDLNTQALKRGQVIEDPAAIVDWVDSNWRKGPLTTRDQNLNITRDYYGTYYVGANKSRRRGGLYYLNPDIIAQTGEFTSRSGQMVATISSGSLARQRLIAAIKKAQELGAVFTISAAPPKAKPVEPEPETPNGGPEGTPPPEENTAEMAARPAPGLYSQVAKAVEAAPMKSGRADQWLGYIKNRPGVKPEELSFMQLPEWLGAQTGAISKEAVTDYVRANQLQVHEVEKADKRTVATGKTIFEARDELAQQQYQTPYGKLSSEQKRWVDDELNSQGPTKYHGYVLPGGKNYKETLFTLPVKDRAETIEMKKVGGWLNYANNEIGDYMRRNPGAVPARDQELARLTLNRDQLSHQFESLRAARGQEIFRDRHWPDNPNTFAHTRHDERWMPDPNGPSTNEAGERGWKVLHLAEIQSGLHQEGRRKGYGTTEPMFEVYNEHGVIESAHATREEAEAKKVRTAERFPHMDPQQVVGGWTIKETKRQIGVPDAPLKNTSEWAGLAFKRMIRYAAENGFDRITWDTGETNAARFDLSKQIDLVRYFPKTRRLIAKKAGQSDYAINQGGVEKEQLPEFIGKQAADHLLQSSPITDAGDGKTYHELSGLDLKVGGEGQLGFYDDILPKVVNKLVKKYGAQVGSASLSVPQETALFGITPTPRGFAVFDREAPHSEIAHFATMEEAEAWTDANEHVPDKSAPVHSLDLTPALKEAALGEGFPVFQGARTEQTPALQAPAPQAGPRLTEKATRADVEKKITEFLDGLTGGRFSKGLSTVAYPDAITSKAGGLGTVAKANTAGGSYAPISDVIKIALGDPQWPNPFKAAAHEGTHFALEHFASDQEMALIRSPAERARMIDWLAPRMGLSHEDVASMSPYEIEAYTGQHYIEDRQQGGQGSGLHIGIRRLFEKIMDIFRKLGNWLRGHGFSKWQDVYEELASGRMGERESRRDAGEPSRLDAEILAEREQAPERAAAIAARPENVAEMALRPRRGPAPPPGANPSFRERMDRFMNSSAVERFVEGTQDLSVKVARLEREVEARMMGVLPDSKAFYEMKRLFPGKRDNRVKNFNAEHLLPMTEALKAAKITAEEAGEYLYARHAIERNEKLGALYEPAHQFHQAMTDDSIVGASGMSASEARDIRDRVENGPKAAAYRDLVARIAAIRDGIIDSMVRDHLISQDTADAWRDQYTDYVPLSGLEGGDEEGGNFGGAKASVRGPEVKQAFGRRSKADNPFVNILDQAYRTIERGERNRYMRSLARALRGLPRAALDDIGVKLERGLKKKIIDNNTGLVREVDDYAARFSPNAVQYKVRGTSHYLYFSNRDMAEAINRLYPDQLNPVGQGLLNIENKLKAMWTHYAPDFLSRHFLGRYPIEGLLNNFEQGGGAKGAFKFLQREFPFLGEASRAIFARERGENAGQMGQYWDEMKEFGGMQGFRQSRDTDLMRESLRLHLKSLSRRSLLGVRDKAIAAREMMDHVTNTLDNAIRLAAYAEARERGVSPQKAALIAREATVDFQLRGKWANAIGLWFPFGNIAIQTAARMTKATNRSATMRKVFLGTAAAGFALAMYNYLVGGNDKDGVPFFEKIAPWERRLNLIILNPFDRDAKGRPQPIKIPMPYNWAFPLALGYGIGNLAFGKMDKGTTLGFILHSAMEAFTPAGGAENKTDLLMPELTRPLGHVMTNRDAFNRPVHQDDPYGQQKQPNSYSGRKDIGGVTRTGQGWKTFAQSINDLTGGNAHKSGKLDFYPEDYREIFDYVFGSQHRLVQNTIDTGKGVANQVSGQGPGPKPTSIPLSRVFYGTDYDAADRAMAAERARASKQPWR